MVDLKIQVAYHLMIIGVVLIQTDAEKRPDMKITKMYDFSTWTTVPWMGVIRVGTEYTNGTESVIPVVMITDKTAIADARSITSLQNYSSETIRNSIKVMFSMKNNIAWYAKLSKYFIHPDFNQETLSTIALLFLDYDLKNFTDNMLQWPLKFSDTLYKSDQIFAIGYTMTRDNVLEQVPYHMEYVKHRDCQQFYIAEKLDSVWMRPTYFHCYKVRTNDRTCVSIPGMALARYSGGRYTLIGISVWGPGCVLPGRFVDFEPYVPWIMSKILTESIRQPEQIGSTRLEDRHHWIIEKVNDSRAFALRPLKQNANMDLQEEILHGGCNTNAVRDGQLIYREAFNFTTRPRPSYVKIKAIATFALSFYDRQNNETCIQIIAHCKHRSDSWLDFTKSFDKSREPFKPYIQTIQDNESDENKPYIYRIKGFYNKHSYEIFGLDVTKLIFKFEFIKEAYIELQFFGNSTTTFISHHPQPQNGQPNKEPEKLPTSNQNENNQNQALKFSSGAGGTYLKQNGSASFKKKRTSATKRPKERKEENWWHRWWRIYMEKLPNIHLDWKLG